MKILNVEKIEQIEAGGWLEGIGCAAGIALVIASVAPTGTNIIAFATGVEAIAEYCGNVRR